MIFTETNAVFKRKLADLMIACPVGGRLTFDEMTRALGFDVRQKRHVIDAARRMANKETGAIFLSVPRHGYDRLTGNDAYVLESPARKHIRRTARVTAQTMTNAVEKCNDVSQETLKRVSRAASTLGLIAYMAQDRSVHPKSEAATPPPSADTIRAFIEAQKGLAA